MTTVSAPGQAIKAKNHYPILDGLRGVAALTVVVFHLFEVYAFGDRFKLILNHGYLAVDFFFMLSGFVVAYAYDDRWNQMSQAEFYKRRLIRLQPMVLMGMTVGALLFYIQASHKFPRIATTHVWQVMMLMLMGYFMIPLPVPFKIHGYQEMYPLDGPVWSLFYEYLANLLYGLGLRKLSNKALAVLSLLSAGLIVHLAVFGGQGDLNGGFAFTPTQLHFGFARILFPFSAGILIMRCGVRIHVKGAFWLSNLLLIICLAFPRLGGLQSLWINGLFESVCIIVVFPVIVAMGASDRATDALAAWLSRVLGALSYPLYVTHFALINIYTAWVVDKTVSPTQGALAGAVVLAASLALAYVCWKFYDEPVRRWLSRRFLIRPKT